jgi:ABC-type multidrug transport system fused ATPase/permease subunit
VYERFREAASGRCAVFISHRLGSARLADRIVVLQHGHVVEEGTHETLVRAGGEYARLYRLQAAWYADTTSTLAAVKEAAPAARASG